MAIYKCIHLYNIPFGKRVSKNYGQSTCYYWVSHLFRKVFESCQTRQTRWHATNKADLRIRMQHVAVINMGCISMQRIKDAAAP